MYRPLELALGEREYLRNSKLIKSIKEELDIENTDKFLDIMLYNNVSKNFLNMWKAIKNFEKRYYEIAFSKDTKPVKFDINKKIKGIEQSVAIQDWLSFKKVYMLDEYFCQELLNTKALSITYDLVKNIPYNSFCVDLTYNKMFDIDYIFVTKRDRLFYFIYYKGNKRYSYYDFLNNEKDILNINDKFAKLRYLMYSLMLFLQAQNKDVIEDELQGKIYRAKNINKDKDSSVQKWKVGFRYAEKIKAYKSSKEHAERVLESTQSSHSRPRPHIRKAHWHRFWCGKGEKKHVEVRWVHPCIVNGGENDIIPSANKIVGKEMVCSEGEALVKAYLEKIDCEFSREYIVHIKGHERRYDFVVYTDKGKMFIEFDGKQHFTSVKKFGGYKAYKERITVDWLKNMYAKENHIPLLRIRFDQKQDIPFLIDDFLIRGNIHKLNSILSNEEYYSIRRELSDEE